MKKIVLVGLAAALMVGLAPQFWQAAAAGVDSGLRIGISGSPGTTSHDMGTFEHGTVQTLAILDRTTNRPVKKAEIDSLRIDAKVKVSNGREALKSCDIKYNADGTAYVEILFGKVYANATKVKIAYTVYLTMNGSRDNSSEFVLTGYLKSSGIRSPGGSSGSSRGSGGGGSGSGSIGGRSDRNPTTPTSTELPWKVNEYTAVERTRSAVGLAERANAETAVVRFQNANTISLSTLKAMAVCSRHMPLKVYAESLKNDEVDVRLSLAPIKAERDMMLYATTNSDQAATLKSNFEKAFGQTVNVIHFYQRGDFGMEVEVAFKPKGLELGSLHLYRYVASSNTYEKMDAECKIDSNGYIHFMTTNGDYVVVSNTPLAK